MQVRFLGLEDPLEKEMATQSSVLAWKILWTVEPGRLQLDTTEQQSTHGEKQRIETRNGSWNSSYSSFPVGCSEETNPLPQSKRHSPEYTKLFGIAFQFLALTVEVLTPS